MQVLGCHLSRVSALRRPRWDWQAPECPASVGRREPFGRSQEGHRTPADSEPGSLLLRIRLAVVSSYGLSGTRANPFLRLVLQAGDVIWRWQEAWDRLAAKGHEAHAGMGSSCLGAPGPVPEGALCPPRRRTGWRQAVVKTAGGEAAVLGPALLSAQPPGSHRDVARSSHCSGGAAPGQGTGGLAQPQQR